MQKKSFLHLTIYLRPGGWLLWPWSQQWLAYTHTIATSESLPYRSNREMQFNWLKYFNKRYLKPYQLVQMCRVVLLQPSNFHRHHGGWLPSNQHSDRGVLQFSRRSFGHCFLHITDLNVSQLVHLRQLYILPLRFLYSHYALSLIKFCYTFYTLDVIQLRHYTFYIQPLLLLISNLDPLEPFHFVSFFFFWWRCELDNKQYRIMNFCSIQEIMDKLSHCRRNSRLSFTYKSLHGLAAISTSPFRRSSKPTRSADGDTFCVLSSWIVPYKYSDPHTIVDWNALPASVKSRPSIH